MKKLYGRNQRKNIFIEALPVNDSHDHKISSENCTVKPDYISLNTSILTLKIIYRILINKFLVIL